MQSNETTKPSLLNKVQPQPCVLGDFMTPTPSTSTTRTTHRSIQPSVSCSLFKLPKPPLHPENRLTKREAVLVQSLSSSEPSIRFKGIQKPHQPSLSALKSSVLQQRYQAYYENMQDEQAERDMATWLEKWNQTDLNGMQGRWILSTCFRYESLDPSEAKSYIHHFDTPDIHDHVTLLVQKLKYFEQRYLETRQQVTMHGGYLFKLPKNKRRLVMGIRQVTSSIDNNKVLCLIVAINNELRNNQGLLDSALHTMLLKAHQHSIPIVFSHTKRQLSDALFGHKKTAVGCVGILNDESMQETRQSLLSLVDEQYVVFRRLFERWVELGYEKNHRNENLYWVAVWNGYHDEALFKLFSKCNINEPDAVYGETPIMVGARLGRVSSVKTLFKLDLPLDLSLTSFDGSHVLHLAIKHHHIDIVQQILDYALDKSMTGYDATSKKWIKKPLMEFLLYKQDYAGQSVFHMALSDVHLVDLVTREPNHAFIQWESRDHRDYTCVMAAAEYDKKTLYTLWSRIPTDIKSRLALSSSSRDGSTLLMIMARMNYPFVTWLDHVVVQDTSVLLDYVVQRDTLGCSAFWWAIYCGSVTFIQDVVLFIAKHKKMDPDVWKKLVYKLPNDIDLSTLVCNYYKTASTDKAVAYIPKSKQPNIEKRIKELLGEIL